MFFDRPAVFLTFKGGHSHRGDSFYAGHHFDRPNPPKDCGKGNHNNHNFGNHNNSLNNNHNNGNLSHNGNNNWNHNGNRPPMGNGNVKSNGNNNSVGTGFGNNSHRSVSATTPARTFSNPQSGNVANNRSNSNNAPRGSFGGGARR